MKCAVNLKRGEEEMQLLYLVPCGHSPYYTDTTQDSSSSMLVYVPILPR